MKNTWLILAFSVAACQTNSEMKTTTETQDLEIPDNFDWQGHRGCRGLMPENTIDAFLHALEFPIQTLELDVVLSKDLMVVVSHEPWFSSEICVDFDAENNNLFALSYAEIKAVDCGSKMVDRFPNQKKLITHKPSLIEVVSAVRAHCKKQNRPLPRFNIELKSQKDWIGTYLPERRVFVEQVYQTIRALGIEELTTIQSFDSEVLSIFMGLQTKLRFAFLTESDEAPLDQLEVLPKMPHIYSPNYKLVNDELIEQLKMLKVKVIPWTVNDVKTMKSLIRMGVDGIITDYPNLILEL